MSVWLVAILVMAVALSLSFGASRVVSIPKMQRSWLGFLAGFLVAFGVFIYFFFEPVLSSIWARR